MKAYLALSLGIIALAGCRDAGPTGPAADPSFGSTPWTPGATGISAMTRNLYIGADVDAVITALVSPDPNDDVPALLEAIGVLARTDFPARAEAIADEIARTRPHVVGLQEVDRLQIDLTGLGVPVVIDQNALPTLQAAFTARGLNYQVAAQVTNITTTPFPGITLTDQDVLLADADRVTVDATVAAETFTHNIGVVAPGVDLRRGFVVVDAHLDGMAVRIATTHLESGDAAGLAGLRAAQAAELVSWVGAAAPAVLLGDFNDTPGSPMYAAVTGAGFTDAWAALRPGASGLTCCELPDLSNPVAAFSERIDYVFTRGLGGPGGKLLGQVTRTGAQPGDRVPGPAYPIWPSDHAGLVLDALVPPEVAHN